MYRLTVLALALLPVTTAGSAAEGALSFEVFTKKFGRHYHSGLSEYQERRALFQDRLGKVSRQNSLPKRRWTAAINAFSDRTNDELARLRGWRRRGSPKEFAHHKSGHDSQDSLSLRQTGRGKSHKMAKTVSWAFLNATKRHYNQGSCGSCWAIASAVLLEAHSEIHSPEGQSRSFSSQELVSCVPNPEHCGGTGGCEGATIELAMDYTLKHGLADDVAVPYQAIDGECRAHKSSEGASLLQIMDKGGVRTVSEVKEDPDEQSLLDSSSPGKQFGMMSWERLPENNYEALLHAVQDGPVGISVAASDWFEYSHGIFDRCEKDAVIDHAVVLIGYGHDPSGEGYWLIKNSWGAEWGEHGSMRLLRRRGGSNSEAEDEGGWCGVDSQPELGSGCDGGPSEVDVCGTCGILYDTVVPHWKGSESSEKAKQRALAQEEY